MTKRINKKIFVYTDVIEEYKGLYHRLLGNDFAR